jgi:hypothetical protein
LLRSRRSRFGDDDFLLCIPGAAISQSASATPSVLSL